MFCVECGKEKEIFKDGVCVNCYLKHASFTKGPEIIDIIACTSCSSYKFKNTWFSESFDETLQRHIKENFQISRELKKIQIKTDCDEKRKNIVCNVEISGFVKDQLFSEQHKLIVRIKKTNCDVCSKQFGGYFEAILQIRAEKRKPSKDELVTIRDTVETLIKTIQEKGNRRLFITDVFDERGGIDFYLSEKGSAHNIAKKIQEKYGGEIKQSSTNAGMKDSRQIYRMTYLIRLPAYRKGDFISYANSFYYISSINKNKVHVIELLNWSEHVFDGKDLQKASIFGGYELVKEMILVSQSKGEVQVMDQKNYKTYDVRKPMDVSFDHNIINIVQLSDQIFLLPEKNTIDK